MSELFNNIKKMKLMKRYTFDDLPNMLNDGEDTNLKNIEELIQKGMDLIGSDYVKHEMASPDMKVIGMTMHIAIRDLETRDKYIIARQNIMNKDAENIIDMRKGIPENLSRVPIHMRSECSDEECVYNEGDHAECKEESYKGNQNYDGFMFS